MYTKQEKISIFIFISVVLLGLLSLFVVPFSFDDTGYYFKYAQEIASGKNGLLYRDIRFNYTPIPVFLYSFVFDFYKELPPNYAFLLINYIFILGSALCINNILRYLNISLSLRFYSLSIYIISVISINTCSTEHFVIFFELLMLNLLLLSKKNIFILLSGISAFLAFYSKQYGIVSIFLGYLFLVYPKIQYKKLLYFTLGILLVNISIAAYYYIYGDGFTFFDFYSKVLLPKYKNEAVLTGEGYNMNQFLVGFVQFILVSLYIIPALYSYFRNKLFSKYYLNYFVICIAANMSQFLLATSFHYYLLVLPFFLIFSVYSISYLNLNKKLSIGLISAFLLISFVFWTGAFIRIKNIDNKWQSTRIIKFNPNNELQLAANSLNKIIPRKSKVFIEASVFFYYTADLYSIDIKNLGYTWSQQQQKINNVLMYMDSGEYLLTRTKIRFKEYPEFVENVAMKSDDYEVFTWVSDFPVGTNYKFYIVHKK